MSDEHKAALAKGRMEGRVVRDYLEGLRATKPKRGRKRTRDPRNQELERLQRENERLNKKLGQAELIIEIPKKVAALLGNPLETPPNSEALS